MGGHFQPCLWNWFNRRNVSLMWCKALSIWLCCVGCARESGGEHEMQMLMEKSVSDCVRCAWDSITHGVRHKIFFWLLCWEEISSQQVRVTFCYSCLQRHYCWAVRELAIWQASLFLGLRKTLKRVLWSWYWERQLQHFSLCIKQGYRKVGWSFIVNVLVLLLFNV